MSRALQEEGTAGARPRGRGPPACVKKSEQVRLEGEDKEKTAMPSLQDSGEPGRACVLCLGVPGVRAPPSCQVSR